MASDIVSEKSEEGDLVLTWSGRWTLAHRILAVNVLTLVLVGLAIVYLDSYRNRLEKERVHKVEAEAGLAAAALPSVGLAQQQALLGNLGRQSDTRMRVYGTDGQLQLDSWRVTGPTYRLRDPTTQKWTKDVARALDRGFNALVGEENSEDFAEPAVDRAEDWSEVMASRQSGRTEGEIRQAPELTPVFSAAAPVAGGSTLLITDNDRDFTRRVRKQRSSRCSLPGPSSCRYAASPWPRTRFASAGRGRSRCPASPLEPTKSDCLRGRSAT
jgi:two-component system sensor histidine kinase ChvG